MAAVLGSLWEAGAFDQVAVLLARGPATHVPLYDPDGVNDLLHSLHRAGAREQFTVLAERLPAAGYFDSFIDIGEHRERFRFGREPDGSAAAPWSWEDLK